MKACGACGACGRRSGTWTRRLLVGGLVGFACGLVGFWFSQQVSAIEVEARRALLKAATDQRRAEREADCDDVVDAVVAAIRPLRNAGTDDDESAIHMTSALFPFAARCAPAAEVTVQVLGDIAIRASADPASDWALDYRAQLVALIEQLGGAR